MNSPFKSGQNNHTGFQIDGPRPPNQWTYQFDELGFSQALLHGHLPSLMYIDTEVPPKILLTLSTQMAAPFAMPKVKRKTIPPHGRVY